MLLDPHRQHRLLLVLAQRYGRSQAIDLSLLLGRQYRVVAVQDEALLRQRARELGLLLSLELREQFGSQMISRSRSTGATLDLGFDLKGASTDAMKKCASLLGVGLYLSRKEATRPMVNHR